MHMPWQETPLPKKDDKLHIQVELQRKVYHRWYIRCRRGRLLSYKGLGSIETSLTGGGGKNKLRELTCWSPSGPKALGPSSISSQKLWSSESQSMTVSVSRIISNVANLSLPTNMSAAMLAILFNFPYNSCNKLRMRWCRRWEFLGKICMVQHATNRFPGPAITCQETWTYLENQRRNPFWIFSSIIHIYVHVCTQMGVTIVCEYKI